MHACMSVEAGGRKRSKATAAGYTYCRGHDEDHMGEEFPAGGALCFLAKQAAQNVCHVAIKEQRIECFDKAYNDDGDL